MNKTTVSDCWLCGAAAVPTYPVYDRQVCIKCLEQHAPNARRDSGYIAPRLTFSEKLERAGGQR